MSEIYQYRAWDRSGKAVRGTIQVEDGEDVERAKWRLRVQGLFVTSIEPLQESKPSFWSLSLSSSSKARKLSAKEMAVFSRQLGIMLGTGMPVVSALRILAAQQRHAGTRFAIETIIRRVSTGDQLSTAFRQAGRTFSTMFVDMLEVGEKSGNLPEVLDRLSRFYEREAKLRGDIKQAMTYPTVVMSFAVIAIGVVLFVVLPIFADMFAGFDAELPWITRMVLGLRDTVVRYYLILVPSFILGIWLLTRWLKTERGRTKLDLLLLKMPIVGPLLSRIIFSRFARTLGLLFASGVSMVESLSSCQKVVSNRVVANDIASARAELQQGKGLADPLRSAKSFPPMLVEMIHVGEETGDLDKVLSQVSDFYEQEVEQAVSGLSSVLEPVVMVMIAGVISIVLVSVFIPMFQIVDVIQ